MRSWLAEGDAHIVRNAELVTDGVGRSLVISQRCRAYAKWRSCTALDAAWMGQTSGLHRDFHLRCRYWPPTQGGRLTAACAPHSSLLDKRCPRTSRGCRGLRTEHRQRNHEAERVAKLRSRTKPITGGGKKLPGLPEQPTMPLTSPAFLGRCAALKPTATANRLSPGSRQPKEWLQWTGVRA